MRVQVVWGDNGEELTINTNRWLEDNEKKVVVLSISPAAASSRNGSYITIVYEPGDIFGEEQVEKSRNQ